MTTVDRLDVNPHERNEPMFTTNPTASELDAATDERERAARRYVEQLRAFYIHAGVFAASMVVIFAVNLLTNLSAGIAGDWTAWWSAWAFLGWGLGIAVHGLVVRLNRPTPATSSWEQQQIDKVLSR